MQGLVGKSEGRDHLEDPDADGKIFEEWVMVAWTALSSS
jgi:hypothetical protein